MTTIWSRTSSNTATSSPETKACARCAVTQSLGNFRNHLLDFPIFSFYQKTHLRPVQMWWMPRVERGVPLCPWPMQVGVSFGGALIINRFSVGWEAPVWESPSWRDCRELRLYDLKRGLINPSVVKVTRSSKKHAAASAFASSCSFSVLILLLAILFSMVLRMGKKRIECAYVKSDITVNPASWICAFQTETPCLPWGSKHLKSFTNTILSSKKSQIPEDHIAPFHPCICFPNRLRQDLPYFASKVQLDFPVIQVWKLRNIRGKWSFEHRDHKVF